MQCRLSSEWKSSCWLVPPHTDMPYVTAGIIITLKYDPVWVGICSSL